MIIDFYNENRWDYSASELGAGKVFNPATMLINFLAWCGWVWDLKKVRISRV